jgi:multiple sugar transport system substrate-binding protein
MKKTLFCLAVMMLGSLSLVWAGGGQESEAAAGRVTLRFMTTEDYTNAESPLMVIRNKYYESFKTKYPNIEIKMELVPWEQIYSQVIVADEAGAAPDIFWMGARASYEVLKGERAMPLDDYLSRSEIKDLAGPILNMATEEGKHYLMPTTTDVRVLYYRKDFYRDAGLNPEKPPRYWADLIATAQKLNDPPGRWGFGFVGGRTLHTAHLWMPNIWMNGGDLIDENKKAIYNSEAGQKAGQYYADLVHKYKVTPKEGVSLMYPDLQRGIIAGNFAMAVMGSWSYKSQYIPALGEENIGWSRMPIPKGGKDASFSGGWGFMISSRTERADEAWKFIEHMASEEAMREVGLLLTYLPHRKSVIDDPEIKDTFIGQMAAYATEASGFNPKNENNGPFFDGMTIAVQEFMQGTKSVKQALDDAVNEYNAKY